MNSIIRRIEPSDTYLETATVATKRISRIRIIQPLKRPTIVPAVVATPFPPLKLR